MFWPRNDFNHVFLPKNYSKIRHFKKPLYSLKPFWLEVQFGDLIGDSIGEINL